jgi:hypothetical protein
MGYVCVECGNPWDPAHMCQGMLTTIADDARLAQIRGEKSFGYNKSNFAVPAPDKSPSFQELDHRLRPRSWR